MSVACPGCGAGTFQAIYRVPTVCQVELTRDEHDEILIGPPGTCVVPAPAASERDFYELVCAACGERLDWDMDHRSLYVWERRPLFPLGGS